MKVHIKICGFTTVDGIRAAIDAGVDSIGLVLDPSPRQLTLDTAIDLAAHIPKHIQTVAVCGRPPQIQVQEIWTRLQPDWIQLMADALPDPALSLPVIPAFEDGDDLLERVKSYVEDSAQAQPLVLADGPKPGSGIVADWGRVESICSTTRLMVAGGLNAQNVGDAIARLRPWGVDVSSGVEQTPGIKSPDKIRDFVAAVRNAERLLEKQ